MTVRIIRDDATASDLRRQSGRVKDGMQWAALAIAWCVRGRRERSRLKGRGMDRQTLRDGVHRYNAEGIEDCATVVEVG